jgi:hypothetical protein
MTPICRALWLTGAIAKAKNAADNAMDDTAAIMRLLKLLT